MPIPDIMAKLGSKFISLKVRAQADSHVPKPAIPLMGRAPVISAPVVPRMVLQKLNVLREKPWLLSREKRSRYSEPYFANRMPKERKNIGQ